VAIAAFSLIYRNLRTDPLLRERVDTGAGSPLGL